MTRIQRWLYKAKGDYDVTTGRPFEIQFYVYAPTAKLARKAGQDQLKHTFRQLKSDFISPMEN